MASHAVAGITLAGSASLVLLVLLARKLGRSCCWHTSRPPPRTPNHAAALLSPQSQSPAGSESECSRECATCAFRIARWDAVRHAAQAAGVADVDAFYAGTAEELESASASGSEGTELTVPTPDWGSESGECQQLQWASTPELDESFRFYADMFAEYAGAGSSEEFEFRLEESKRESRAS